MNPYTIGIISTASIAYIGVTVHPVVMMLFPIMVVYIGLTALDMSEWIASIAVVAILLDSFSGLPFGMYTISLLVLYAVLYGARQLLFSSEDIVFLVPTGAFFVIVYMLLLVPWTGFASLAVYWQELTVLYLFAILILHYAFLKISRRTI